MSIVTAPPMQTAVDDGQPYEITADEFFAMIEAGVFPREARVYLQEGRIYEKMAKTNIHDAVGAIVLRTLMLRLPPNWTIWPETQIKLDRKNGPLPDFAVIRGGDPFAFVDQNRRPESGDIGLLIEIAVTSFPADLGPRLERYARAMIPAYWVLDFPGRRILAHASPRVVDGRGEYTEVVQVVSGGSVHLVLDGHELGMIPYEELLR